MHIHPTLTPAALERWERMDPRGRALILERIWCVRCNGAHGIRDACGELHPSGDIMLSGVCPVCGSRVARVIETGDRMGPARVYP